MPWFYRDFPRFFSKMHRDFADFYRDFARRTTSVEIMSTAAQLYEKFTPEKA